MAFTIDVGSISVSINPAALLSPVVAHPSSTAAVYATFAESVSKNGLAKTVFEAFQSIVSIDNHNVSKSKWPTKYGTSDKPWGQPADPEKGWREESLVDGSDGGPWTDAIHSSAKSRKSFLEHYAELATAIATGIKVAMESKIRTGKVFVPGYTVPGTQNVAVSIPLSVNSEIFIQARPQAGEIREANLVSIGLNQFVIGGDAGPQGYEVSWMVVG